MFKRKEKSSSAPAEQELTIESSLGISAGRDVLFQFWLYTTLGIMLPLLAGFAYLLFLRDPALQKSQILNASAGYASQQAAAVDQMLTRYRERLVSAAQSPLSLAAIASGNLEDISLVEKAMLDYFPEFSSLRLIPLTDGGTGIAGGDPGLRNHIELDIVRRTGEGEDPVPESYQFEGKWLTSFAVLESHPQQPGRRAVFIATLKNVSLNQQLFSIAGDIGRTSLLQIYRKGSFAREIEIAAAGDGTTDTDYDGRAELKGAAWAVIFTPSARTLAAYRTDKLPVLLLFGGLALLVFGGLSTLLFMGQRALVSQADLILTSAESKSPLEISLPVLLPLARAIRKFANRPTRAAIRTQAAGSAAQELAVEEQLAAKLPTRAQNSGEESAGEANGEIPGHIFRAYDIRGIVGTELTEDSANVIGRALGTLAGARGEEAFVVGLDGRTSSPAIKSAFVRGLVDSGRDVIDIGIVPTPLLYYATHTLGVRSGVMVTASHNPANYNGFKITLAGRPFAGDDLQELRDTIRQGKFSDGAGRLAKNDVADSYIDAIVSDIAISSPLKRVVYAGNGAAGEIAPAVLENLSCEVSRLYCEIDGSFPNHHPDPSVEANLADLQTAVPELGADFGVAYDGDGDRMCVVTRDGSIVRNDQLLMLFTEDVVSRNPGADVIFDIKCTRELAQLVTRSGGRPILCKTGHAFMREKVLETGALLGGEFSGHFYFGERWFGFDDAIYATARLAEIVSSSGADLAELLAAFPSLENTPEIQIPVAEEEKFALMQRLAEEADFSPGKVTDLDGVRVDYNDGWGLLRASNTTPSLVARFEGQDRDVLGRIQQQFREQLLKIKPDMDIGF
jgi:phosphomannomutase/phosphoglucomutase